MSEARYDWTTMSAFSLAPFCFDVSERSHVRSLPTGNGASKRPIGRELDRAQGSIPWLMVMISSAGATPSSAASDGWKAAVPSPPRHKKLAISFAAMVKLTFLR